MPDGLLQCGTKVNISWASRKLNPFLFQQFLPLRSIIHKRKPQKLRLLKISFTNRQRNTTAQALTESLAHRCVYFLFTRKDHKKMICPIFSLSYHKSSVCLIGFVKYLPDLIICKVLGSSIHQDIIAQKKAPALFLPYSGFAYERVRSRRGSGD